MCRRLTEKRKMKFAAAIFFVGMAIVGCQTSTKQTGPGDTVAVGSQTDSGLASQKATPAVNPDTDRPGKNEIQIVIENFVFQPSEVTIAPGTKVTWINKDDAPHTATSTDKKFGSGGLDTGDKFSYVFNDKGDYPYFCALHPHMKAHITVK
jgi:plastocyanin